MSWQGVPFNFFNTESVGNIFLTLSKLPVISVDTGFGWDNFFSALIGGLIPAGIAWLTIRHNNKSGDRQREQQIIDLEQMRQTQLKISETSFNAQVLSSNRQNWIIHLRDLAADFSKLCNSHIYYRRLYVAEYEGSRWGNGTVEQAAIYFDNVLATGADLGAAFTKVKLMLNPNEITSGAIISSMKEMVRIAKEKEVSDMPKALFQNDPEYFQYEQRFLDVVQRCLKAEWKRVKAGK